MGQIWIESTSKDGDESSARWGGDDITDTMIDAVTEFVKRITARGPDTIA